MCTHHAPFIAFSDGGKAWTVTQGNCHHWTCPRCGQLRARAEYGRIVEGCRLIEQQHELYFLTLTSPGEPMSAEKATEKWLEWTNRFLDACRANAKKRGEFWAYAGVTEWQKRGHPHSHYLTTFYPADLTDGFKVTTLLLANGGSVTGAQECLRSEWLQKRVISAGLGEQYDVSQVVTVEGVSRYVAKYLFKASVFSDDYPKNWRRVRYSDSFPKLPKRASTGMALLSADDWRALESRAFSISCADEFVESEARWRLRGSDVVLKLNKRLSPTRVV